MARTLIWLWALALLAGCTQSPVARRPASSSPPGPLATVSTPPSTPLATSSSPSDTSAPAPPAARTSARTSAPAIAPLSAKARAAGLLDIRTIVPDALIDLRYKTSDNFVGVRLYPADARCLVHRSMRAGLITAAAQLRREGFRLVFWDCYRPHYVQVHMFEIVPNPDWVARPGPYATSHESGRSVDVTLAYASPAAQCAPARRVGGRCLLSMGTNFDDFTARAHAFATEGLSATAQRNRAVLRHAMNAGGIVVYAGEWWHFDGPGSGVPRPHLDAPLS